MPSLTRAELVEINNRANKIKILAGKVWKAKYYKWANEINWQAYEIKRLVQQVIGQIE